MIIKLAEKTVRVRTVYRAAEFLCREYLSTDDSMPDFEVCTEQADIDVERLRSEERDRTEGREPRDYSDPYLETLAVYRKIAERMPVYDTFLFHGSCVAADGAGYLFTAPSGTGKSTHARLWRELLGDEAVMVNDDKPLIRVREDGAAIVYGTPWNGKHRLGRNIAVRLKAVCALERAEENRIEEISRQEAFPILIRQAYRPADPALLTRTLQLLGRLDVRFYRLYCNMDISAAELSYRTMSKKDR